MYSYPNKKDSVDSNLNILTGWLNGNKHKQFLRYQHFG